MPIGANYEYKCKNKLFLGKIHYLYIPIFKSVLLLAIEYQVILIFVTTIVITKSMA